jgi:hypothetical protein
MASDRHTGHLLGVVNLVLFLKIKPHSRQRAGAQIIPPDIRKDFSICGKCS